MASKAHIPYARLFGIMYRRLSNCVIKQIAIITHYRVDLEAIIVDFFGGFIANIGYATENFNAENNRARSPVGFQQRLEIAILAYNMAYCLERFN